uniref:Uncharacterized protein n=1 Tax=Tanacetum cinerariifolium TaxID=118510 RepID=A0A6L2MDT0_TANCI|nr:hypothetical protein [Tanacetum cinerariifolium]
MLIPLGEGSRTPTKPHHTPSPEAQQTSPTTHSSPTLPPVTTAPIPTVTPSDTPHLRQYTRRARIAQSSALPHVVEEHASPLRDVNQGEACPTGFSLDAEQDMANIAKTSTLPHESTSRVTSLVVYEGEALELEINSLKARITLLEDKDRGVAEHSGDDTPINGRNLDEGEAEAERVSDNTEEMETVLTSMDAASILTSRGVQVVPTAAEVATATEYEQLAEDLSIGERVELLNDLTKYQENYAQILKYQTQQRKPWSKKQKRDYYMVVIKSNLGWKVKDFRGMTFKEIEAKFTIESVKKVKTSEEVPKEVKTPDEVPKEKVKEMMQLVPIEEVYVEALQVKHPIINWKVHTEGQRSYWKITRLGGISAIYQFFVDLLKHLDREDLNQLWALVKESLNIRPTSSDKEMEL